MARPTAPRDVPIPFIKSENNRFTLSEEACSMLSTVENRLGVVAIAGAYRTGKSFILNRLLNRQEGFAVGPTVKPCTKGLWIWGKPVDHRLPSGEVISLIFLDTEGLGSTDQTQTHDVQVFSLALLLSSYFVFNSLSSIGEEALNQLSLVVNLTNHIHVRSHSGPDSSEDTSELARYFPSFLWLVRDFALQLEVDGKPITSREYMENSLAPVRQSGGGSNERLQSKNKVRQLLTTFFKDRDCVTLVRPLLDERELQQLDKLPFAKCRPEFRTQVDKLKDKVLSSVTPKQLNGSLLNGPMFVQLARNYVDAINKGGIPVIQNAWENVVRVESLNAVSLAVAAYREYIDSQKLSLPVDDQELDRINLAAREKGLERFRERAITGTDVATYLKDLKGRFDTDFELLKAHNEKSSRDSCEALVRDMWAKAEIDKKAYSSFQLFDQDRIKVMASFLQTAKGPSKTKALLDGIERLSVPVMMKLQEAVETEKERLRAERDEVRRQADLAQKKATDDRAALQQSLIQANQQVNEERLRSKAAEDAARKSQSDLQRQHDADVAKLKEDKKVVQKQLNDTHAVLENARQEVVFVSKEASSKVTEFQRQLDGEKSKNEAMRKELEALRKSSQSDLQKLRAESEEILRQNHQMQIEKEELVAERRRLQGQLQQAETEKGGLEAELHQQKVSASSSSTALQEALEELSKRTSELEAAHGKISLLEKDNLELQQSVEKARSLEQEVAELRKTLDAKSQSERETDRAKQHLEDEIAQLRRELDRVTEESRAREEDLSGDLNAQKVELERSLRDELRELRSEKDAAEILQRELSDKVTVLEHEKQNLKGDLDHKDRLLVELQQKLETENQNLKGELGDKDRLLAELRQKLADENQTLKGELGDKDRLLAELRQKLAAENQTLKGELGDKDRLLAELQHKVAVGSAREGKVEELEQTVGAKEREVSSLKRELEMMEARIADYEADRAPHDSLNGRRSMQDEGYSSPKRAKYDNSSPPTPAGSSAGPAPAAFPSNDDKDDSEPRKDPLKMTIQQLMSALTAADVPLPGVKKEKPFYIKLYKEMILHE